MKLTIDLDQSPVALRKELDQAVRFALGVSFFIEQGSGNFTQDELANPAINIPNGLPALPLPGAGAVAVAASTPPVSVAAVVGVELDSAGHPYDVRIHSGGKSKIANGTWKLAKGMASRLDFVAQVNEQNKALLSATIPAGAPTPTDAVAANALPTLPTLPPVLPIPDAEIVVTDYASFAQFVGQQVAKHGQKATDELNRGLLHYGLVDPATQTPQLPLMAHRPDIVDTFYKWFKATVAA